MFNCDFIKLNYYITKHNWAITMAYCIITAIPNDITMHSLWHHTLVWHKNNACDFRIHHCYLTMPPSSITMALLCLNHFWTEASQHAILTTAQCSLDITSHHYDIRVQICTKMLHEDAQYNGPLWHHKTKQYHKVALWLHSATLSHQMSCCTITMMLFEIRCSIVASACLN